MVPAPTSTLCDGASSAPLCAQNACSCCAASWNEGDDACVNACVCSCADRNRRIVSGRARAVHRRSAMVEDRSPSPPSPALLAAHKHIAYACAQPNDAFVRCKQRDPNPAACLREGDDVTRCVLRLSVLPSFAYLR